MTTIRQRSQISQSQITDLKFPSPSFSNIELNGDRRAAVRISARPPDCQGPGRDPASLIERRKRRVEIVEAGVRNARCIAARSARLERLRARDQVTASVRDPVNASRGRARRGAPIGVASAAATRAR